MAIGDVRELGVAKVTIPELSRPVHAVLEARLDRLDVDNQWDFWLFPKRQTKNGKGMASSPNLFKALSARYPGIARTGTPEGKAADILLTTSCDAEAIAALKSGRRVVILEPTGPEPNVSLGWWSIGNQTGTAMGRHPVFGDFPHDGYLSPLWFRMVKTAPPLRSEDKLCHAEPLMVGEGKDGYSVYLSQARVGQGRLLRLCGLDVFSDALKLRGCLMQCSTTCVLTPLHRRQPCHRLCNS